MSLSYCALVNKSIPNHPTVPLRDQKLSLEGTDFQLLIKFPPLKHITMPDLLDNAWLAWQCLTSSNIPVTTTTDTHQLYWLTLSMPDTLHQCLTLSSNPVTRSVVVVTHYHYWHISVVLIYYINVCLPIIFLSLQMLRHWWSHWYKW